MRKSNPYPRHRSYYAHAIPVTSVGKLVLVLVIFEAAFLLTPMVWGSGDYGLDENGQSLVTPLTTLGEFGMFIIPCLILLVAIRLLHGRGLADLIGPIPAARADLRAAFWWVLAILLIQEPFRIASEWAFITEVKPLDQWLIWILPGMIVLVIQVATEELYFRGYLQQFLAALNPSPWLWMVLPSFFFGLSHLANSPDMIEGLVWAYWAMLLGLACADLTARTGNIGAAIGLHLANNTVAMFLIGVKGWPGTGLVLFLYPFVGFDDTYGLLPDGDGAVLISVIYATGGVWLMWMAARVAVRL